MMQPPMLDGAPQSRFAFDPAWLAGLKLEPANARLFEVRNQRLILADGVFDGDWLLVDISVNKFAGVTLYVLQDGEATPFVRSLELRGGALFQGGNYDSPEIKPLGEQTRILGAVRARLGPLEAISDEELARLGID